MMDNDYPARSSAQPPAHPESLPPALVLVAATLLAIPFVLLTTFSGMSWFDDEGTLLVGFRSLMEGHRMYDDIYSLYGPLYNAVYGLIYAILRIPLTHTAGRLMAAALWLSYTAVFVMFLSRLTRSVPAMLIGFLFILAWLTALMDSPGHPEEICLLLLAAVLLLTCSFERARSIAALMGIGAAVAALALVKINIGAYVGGGIILVFLRASAPTKWTRIAIPFMVAALMSLPFAVQALLLDFDWVRSYILFSTVCIGTALLAVLAVPEPIIIRPNDWSTIAFAGGITCLVVVVGMMLAGSSGYALLNAVLLQNAHFIRNWYLPLHLGQQGLAAAAASALTAVAYFVSASWPFVREYRNVGILALKCIFVMLGAFSILYAQGQVFPMLTPFCWLLIVPPPGDQQLHPVGRGMAGLIGAIMSLYPFPVAGHQINIGALLPVVMVPVLACDVLTSLHGRGVRRLPAFFSTFLAASLVLVLGTAITARNALTYWHNVPLGLPGTSLIRVSQAQADDLRWVTAELASCASSYSMPGLSSFSLWTGHALPTALNINDVLAFIAPARQVEIVQALSNQPDLCVVYNPGFLQWFDRGQIQTDPPLLHYLQANFAAVADRDGFIILKRRISGQVDQQLKTFELPDNQ
jgi:hypothetical protein